MRSAHPARLQPIRAVTFDLDDTLWDIEPVIDRAEACLYDWLRQYFPRIPQRFTPLELRRISATVAQQRPDQAHDRTWLRKRALQVAAEQVGYDGNEFPVEDAFQVFYRLRNAVELYADVPPVLERLSRRYPLAALSNGNADIHVIGLGRVFAFALHAAEVGSAKPDPTMFELACQRLRLAPAQIVHVGDNPEHDVLGGAQAGFRTVWVNRNRHPWPGGRRPDAEITTLPELETWLDHWEQDSALGWRPGALLPQAIGAYRETGL